MPTNVIMPALELAQETGKVLRWMKAAGDTGRTGEPPAARQRGPGGVRRWVRAPGDTVRRGEPIVEIETDKVTVEIEAPATGILRDVTAREGDIVPVGHTIAIIAAPTDSAAPSSLPPPRSPPPSSTPPR